MQLKTMLLPSLSKLGSIAISPSHNKKYSHLLVDNRWLRYDGAAEALNQVVNLNNKRLLGDILVFCHQDIAFDDTTLWERAEKEFLANPNQILGVAGVLHTGRVVSNLKYLDSMEYITRLQIQEKTQAESLDECLFMIPKRLYDILHFDEYVCHHWHLYAVDYCYAARTLFGIKSYVLPESIYHKVNAERGLTTDNHFLKSIWRMCGKYRKTFPVIYTPCYIVSTDPFRATIKIMRTFIKNLIKR